MHNVSPKQSSTQIAGWVGVVLLLAAALAITLPLVTVLSADSRLASLYSSDEEFIARGLERMITHISPNYAFWWYPPLFMNASVVLSLLVHLVGVPIPSAVLIAPRIVSALGYAGSALGTALLTKRLSGSWAPALVAAACIVTVPDVYKFALLAHPDTVQMMLIALSLWVLCGYMASLTHRDLFWASALAGLAFVTKFAGIFLVPPLAAAALWANFARGKTWRAALSATVRHDAPRAAAAFILATLVGAPSFLFNIGAFWKAVRAHSATVGFGYFTRDTRSGYEWLRLLAKPEVLGWLTVVGFAVALVILVAQAATRRRSLLTASASGLAALLVVAGFALCCLGLLMLHSHIFEVRYLYPLLPAVVAVVTSVVWSAKEGIEHVIPAARGKGWTSMPSALVLMALLWLALPLRADGLATVGAGRLEQGLQSCSHLTAWLRGHVLQDARIVYDHYTYVPREFANARGTWGLPSDLVKEDKPAVIIVNGAIRTRYNHEVDATQWRGGEAHYRDVLNTYEQLEQGKLPYERVAEFPACNGAQVYERSGP